MALDHVNRNRARLQASIVRAGPGVVDMQILESGQAFTIQSKNLGHFKLSLVIIQALCAGACQGLCTLRSGPKTSTSDRQSATYIACDVKRKGGMKRHTGLHSGLARKTLFESKDEGRRQPNHQKDFAKTG